MNWTLVAGMILSCIAAFAPSSSPAATVGECNAKLIGSLDLAESGSQLLVPVTFQGTRAYMTLNLASTFSMLTERAVRDFSLPTKKMPRNVSVLSGKNSVEEMATATSFLVGGLQFNNGAFMVLPHFSFREGMADAPVIGILGMYVFEQVDIELDVAHRKMKLFSQDHCPGHTVYWASKYDSAPIRFGSLGEFYFPMELDGKKLETTLATSNSTTTVRTDATRKLYNFDDHSADVERETDSSGRTTAHYRAMKLSGEGIEIVNARVSLIEPPAGKTCYLSSYMGAASYGGCRGVYPLSLGQDILSKLHLYIATKEKMLYFTPASTAE